MPHSWLRVVYTPPTCIMIRLPVVSQYFCGSIRVGGRRKTLPHFGADCKMRHCQMFRSSESKRHLCVVIFRRVPSARKSSIAHDGVPRGSSERRHMLDLALLFMGSLHKCHFRAGAKGSSEGTPRYTSNCLPSFSMCSLVEKEVFVYLTENSHFQDEGKSGF